MMKSVEQQIFENTKDNTQYDEGNRDIVKENLFTETDI